jgi:hypothetical protein
MAVRCPDRAVTVVSRVMTRLQRARRLAARLAAFAACATVVSSCDTQRIPSAPSLPPSVGNPTPPTSPIDDYTHIGDYTITLVAGNCDESSRVALPTEFRTRTYASCVYQNGTNIRVVLNGLPHVAGMDRDPGLWGQIQPDGTMTLTGYYGNDQYEAIFQEVSPTNLLSLLIDEMKLTVSPEGWSGAFKGALWIYNWNGVRVSGLISQCFSPSHSVTLRRSDQNVWLARRSATHDWASKSSR